MADPATFKDLENLVGNVINVILGFAGITFFVLLVIGGIRFITSGGDPKATEGAKKTLTYALGGFLVILLAFLILVLIYKITGVEVRTFKLVQP
jgi:hypothetical protein